MQPTPPGDQPAKYRRPGARTPQTDRVPPAAADAVVQVVRNIQAFQFVWEDRVSPTKKAIRVVVDGWQILIDVHPCDLGTVSTPQGFFMGGAYVRDGGKGNECNLDELAVARRDDLGMDLRDVFIRHFALLFPDQIAAMIKNKNANSIPDQDKNWRRRDDPPKPPPGAPGGAPSAAPSGAPAERRPWHRDKG